MALSQLIVNPIRVTEQLSLCGDFGRKKLPNKGLKGGGLLPLCVRQLCGYLYITPLCVHAGTDRYQVQADEYKQWRPSSQKPF